MHATDQEFVEAIVSDLCAYGHIAADTLGTQEACEMLDQHAPECDFPNTYLLAQKFCDSLVSLAKRSFQEVPHGGSALEGFGQDNYWEEYKLQVQRPYEGPHTEAYRGVMRACCDQVASEFSSCARRVLDTLIFEPNLKAGEEPMTASDLMFKELEELAGYEALLHDPEDEEGENAGCEIPAASEVCELPNLQLSFDETRLVRLFRCLTTTERFAVVGGLHEQLMKRHTTILDLESLANWEELETTELSTDFDERLQAVRPYQTRIANATDLTHNLAEEAWGCDFTEVILGTEEGQDDEFVEELSEAYIRVHENVGQELGFDTWDSTAIAALNAESSEYLRFWRFNVISGIEESVERKTKIGKDS